MVRKIDWIMFIFSCLALITVVVMACYDTTPKELKARTVELENNKGK